MTTKLTAVAGAVALACASANAWAQEAQASETITVTAQKRSEDVREVPLSVSVLSGDAMQDAHVSNFSDLSRAVPNLSFSTQAGPGLATLQMRGISSQAGTATAAIYLDDVSLTTRNLYSQGTAEPRFFDLDRVEVIRGPQGTLYGASALGGTLKFVGKQPDARNFEGSAYAELSNTDSGGTNYNLQGVLNVPLSANTVALRVGVQTGRDSGYIDRVDVNTLKVADDNINSVQWNVAKLALKGEFGAWTVTPALFFQRVKTGDIDASYAAVGDYQSANALAPLDKFQTSKIVREPGKDELTLPSLTVTGDLGFADLTGIVAQYKRRFERVQDGTYINSPYIGSVITNPELGAIVGFLPSAVNLDNKTDQSSIELRLASKDHQSGGSPVTWLAGLYAAKTKTQVYDDEPVYGINAAFEAAGEDIEDPDAIADTFPGAFLNDSSYYSARHYTDKQTAVFGELTWHARDTLRLTAGLRFVRATQHFTREGDRYYAGGPTSALVDSKWTATTPRFALDWDLSPDHTLYANIAKGFRLGSANRPVPDTPLVRQDLEDLGLPPLVPTSYQPDSLWSYEAGTKSRLLGGRLNFTAAFFYIDWKNIQQDVSLPTSAFDFETNAGKAKSYGVELEARWRATDDLTLSFGGGWTHATFAEDTPALGYTDGELNAHKGDRIQGVPEYNATLGVEYRFGGGGFVRASGQWTGSSRGTFVPDSPDYERPGYFTADASVGWTWDRWEFSAFVKNLTNEDKVIQRPDIQLVATEYHLRPRTIGLTARYDF